MTDDDDKKTPKLEPKPAPDHPIQEIIDLFGGVMQHGDVYRLDKYGNIRLPEFLRH